jgi:ubiquinone/menaquinone biosynthesis C-methylase UbiE/DNA-binding transcriptional ArsR family regulator
MELSSNELVDVLRAAGEPTRLRILALLRREELSVMELGQILDQSQPRVSRHLKLLTEAGLVERFPDGAWVFYRLAADCAQRNLAEQALSLLKSNEPILTRDLDRLGQVHQARAAEAAAYFERNAARWDEVRSLYVDESEVERAILAAAGQGPFERMVDLGTGAGRMLTLLGGQARGALGLDLSQQMLNIARRHVAEAGLAGCELRHGDIFATGLQTGSADLVVIHRVLHYLNDPAAAVAEAARLVSPQGQLLIIDSAPHKLEHLRQAHQHRRLGFADDEIERWCAEAGLPDVAISTLPPLHSEGLTVKVWSARSHREGPALTIRRSAA